MVIAAAGFYSMKAWKEFFIVLLWYSIYADVLLFNFELQYNKIGMHIFFILVVGILLHLPPRTDVMYFPDHGLGLETINYRLCLGPQILVCFAFLVLVCDCGVAIPILVSNLKFSV